MRGAGGKRTPSRDDYLGAAESAQAMHRSLDTYNVSVKCQDNTVLAAFIVELLSMRISDSVDASLREVLKGVSNIPLRLWSAAMVREHIKAAGPNLCSVIDKYLFKRYPPAPPTAAERAFLQRLKHPCQAERPVGADSTNLNLPPRRQSRPNGAGESGSDPCGPGQPARTSAAQATKRSKKAPAAAPEPTSEARPAKRARKEYTTKLGTTSSALLITLYMGLQRGQEFMVKDDVIKEATRLGIADVGMQAQTSFWSNEAKSYYSGWSSMKTLLTNELVTKNKTRNKFYLLPRGQPLARRLYFEGVAAGRIPPLRPEDLMGDPEAAVAAGDGAAAGQQTNSDTAGAGPGDSRNAPGPTSAPVSRANSSLQRRPHGVEVEGSVAENRNRSGQTTHGWWRTAGLGEELQERMPPLHADETFRQAYEVVLILDNREWMRPARKNDPFSLDHAIVAGHLASWNVKVEFMQLEQGDALWVARRRDRPAEQYVLDRVVERKRVDDLHNSIIDRRYQAQKYWLMQSGLRYLFYLVEGNPMDINKMPTVTAQVTDASVRRLKTSCIATEIKHGFCLLRTAQQTDTLQLYARMTKELEQACADYAGPRQSDLVTLDDFTTKMRSSKKLSSRDIWVQQLCKVPRLGAEAVEGIVREFPTPLALFRQYRKCAADARAQGGDPARACMVMLQDVKRNGRRIGPAASTKVWELFVGPQAAGGGPSWSV
ncbi:unnamed protein product [Pedinophyceae sp. YPF-701]|nr:unnamed protein product [Pedinophyceae sp. YPF-701]